MFASSRQVPDGRRLERLGASSGLAAPLQERVRGGACSWPGRQGGDLGQAFVLASSCAPCGHTGSPTVPAFPDGLVRRTTAAIRGVRDETNVMHGPCLEVSKPLYEATSATNRQNAEWTTIPGGSCAHPANVPAGPADHPDQDIR